MDFMEKGKLHMSNSKGCTQIGGMETFPTVSIPVDQPMAIEDVGLLALNLAEIAKSNRVNIMLGCVPSMPVPQEEPSDSGSDYADLIQKMAENAIKNSIPWPPLENLKQQTETDDDAIEEEDVDNEDCSDCESRNVCVCNTCDCHKCPLTRNPEKCRVKHWSCEECDGQDPIGVEHEVECPLIKEYLPVMRRFQQLL